MKKVGKSITTFSPFLQSKLLLTALFFLFVVASSNAQVGAVYAMTNGEGQVEGNVQGPNAVVAYAQAADGTLSIIGTYPTGGNGGDYDGGEGLDPLISAYACLLYTSPSPRDRG